MKNELGSHEMTAKGPTLTGAQIKESTSRSL
jgi:hypothetical protein